MPLIREMDDRDVLALYASEYKAITKIKQTKPYTEDGQTKVKVNIYLCTYMHVTAMKIRSHKLERKRGVYGRA